MKKVAVISEHASPIATLGGVDSGGQNVYVAQLARLLADRGWQVDVFTRCESVSAPEAVSWGRATVYHVPAGPARFVPKEELLPHMDQFTHVLKRHCRRFGRYDIIHANFFMSGLVAADLKKALGIPFAVTFHALGLVRRLHQGRADRFPPERPAIEKRVIDEADRIVAECPQDKRDLIRLYGADPAKIHMI